MSNVYADKVHHHSAVAAIDVQFNAAKNEHEMIGTMTVRNAAELTAFVHAVDLFLATQPVHINTPGAYCMCLVCYVRHRRDRLTADPTTLGTCYPPGVSGCITPPPDKPALKEEAHNANPPASA